MKQASPSPVLRVKGVSASFRGSRALEDVSFELMSGEVLGVLGPSGSGKTTLLRCLDGLLPLQAGTIHYALPEEYALHAGEGGVHPSDASRVLRMRVGLVFQGLNLWEDRSVLDNLTLAPRVVRGEEPDSTVDRARALAGRFRIDHLLERRVWQLSGGERQRVAIVRALVMKPQILLLDEVTSALDPLLTFAVMELIRELRDEGLTMVIVTHHLEFASRSCDRILLLDEGRIAAFDTPERVMNAAKDDRLGDFFRVLRSVR